MSNSATNIYNTLFNGADPQGDERPAYVGLVLKLLSIINASPLAANPATDCILQVEAAVGRDSLAAKDFAKALNQSRDRYARS